MLTVEGSSWTALRGREAGSPFCCRLTARPWQHPRCSMPCRHRFQETRRWEDMQLPKVLIVEDEPDMLLGLRDNCEYEGYEVVVASDGESGIQQTLQTRPDIILLDVMLPKLSGLDVCRHLR